MFASKVSQSSSDHHNYMEKISTKSNKKLRNNSSNHSDASLGENGSSDVISVLEEYGLGNKDLGRYGTSDVIGLEGCGHSEAAGDMAERGNKITGLGKYRNSTWLKLWSVLVWLSLVCYSILVLYRVPTFRNGTISRDQTLLIAHKVRDLITPPTLVTMTLNFLLKSSSALEIVRNCERIENELTRSSTNPRRVLCLFVMTTGVLFITGYCCILTTYGGYFFLVPSLDTSTQMYENVFYFLVTSFVMIFYYHKVMLLCHAYERLKISFLEGFREEQQHEGEDLQLENIAENCTTPYHPWWRQNKTLSVSHGDILYPETVRTLQTNNRSTGIQEMRRQKKTKHKQKVAREGMATLANLHNLHRQLNSYLGLPLTLIMTTSVIYSVLACFYFSYVMMMEVKRLVLTAGFNTQIQLRGCDIRFALGIIVKLTIQVFTIYSTSYWWHILNTSTLTYIKEVTSLILYICVDNFVLNFFYVNVRLQTALYENLKASVHSMYSLDQPRRGESGSTEPENDRYNIPDVNTKAPGHFSVSTTTYEYPEALTGLQKIWHVQPFVDETVVSSVYNDSTSVTPVINFSNDLHTTCKPVAPVNPIPEDIYVAHKPAPQVIDRSEDVFSCTMGARNTIETSIRKKKQLRATRHEILHLQDLHRLCVSYLGLLLILDLCMCLVLLILTAFSLSQFWETDLTLFVYMMVMCVEMTLTFLILLNIPTVMQTEVDELRLVLRSLLHRVEEDREVKEEVSFSISVVVIDPLRHSKCT
ncbi:hypothetical protein Pcinc_037239 [Petrolisthes cinctipes]|uniref:Uncharacterized protein n=1 Tax=Petrolisthes cinctipes TaxID=88211 RepID=A0AAE1BTA6_PETCI|nr:hypothetical protein Pcinc_037239 [Petrolisthes cinctipes]